MTAIKHLADDLVLRNTLGTNARQYALEHLNKEDILDLLRY